MRPKHIKLTLKPRYHSDVIAIIDSIEPSKLAATVIQLLRLYPQLQRQGMGIKSPQAEANEVIEDVPPAAPAPAAPASRVSLGAGFDALDD